MKVILRRYCLACFRWVRADDCCSLHPTAGLIDRITMLLRRTKEES